MLQIKYSFQNSPFDQNNEFYSLLYMLIILSVMNKLFFVKTKMYFTIRKLGHCPKAEYDQRSTT